MSGHSLAIIYTLGDRLFLPTAIAPYKTEPDEPSRRPLWIYAADPANAELRQPHLRISVPYEPLTPGPTGALFAVVAEPLHQDLLQMLDWNISRAEHYAANPLDLNNFAIALDAGLRPTTGDLRFAAQMAYAVCQQGYELFRVALGRNPSWGLWAADRQAGDTQLRLKLFSFNEANASYDPLAGALEFGYFKASDTPSIYVLPGGVVFTALSRDIIMHELTHAILDGMRAEFMRDTNLDVAAFHEGFADIVALFSHFSQVELVEQAIAESKGEINSDLLFDLGKQFGEAVNGPSGGALRRALKRGEGPNAPISAEGLYSATAPKEEHDRGSILVAAVFEAFLTVYQRRSRKLFQVARALRPDNAGDLPHELVQLLAEEARRVGGRFLNICIRAIDYCPPVDIQFGSYLRAMITSDIDMDSEDECGYRDALIKAFRRRSIAINHVRDLSEDSLMWKPPQMENSHIPDLAFSKLRFTDNGINRPTKKEIMRRASALGDFIVADPSRLREFGLHAPGAPYGKITIQSIRMARRTGADDMPRNELVAEVTQERRQGRNTFIGGATVIIGMDGSIRYIIRRRVDNDLARRNETKFAGTAGAARLDFRALHGGRSKRKK
jgi:hypothetical protein